MVRLVVEFVAASLVVMIASIATAGFVNVYTLPADTPVYTISDYAAASATDAVDFNDDGRPDLITLDGLTYTIVSLTGADWTPVELWSYSVAASPNGALVADVTPEPGNEVVVRWGSWDTVEHVSVVSAMGELLADIEGYQLAVAADFNGDDLDELLLAPSNSEQPLEVWAYDTVSATSGPLTPRALAPSVPNPFNPSTTIAYEVAYRQNVAVVGYDLGGRRLRALVDDMRMPGRYEVTWNGRDAAGQCLPSGTYIVRLETESACESRKVTILR